jgi:sugar phosphate isomerase/epimerase
MESLEELVPKAKESGVKLALENMLSGYLGDNPGELMECVTALSSDFLGICFDTGHAHCTGSMGEFFSSVKERIVTFHLQDNDGTRDMHVQPGYGTAPWQDFVQVFETMDFADPLIIEARPWNGASIAVMLEEQRLLFQHAGLLGPQRLSERLSRRPEGKAGAG